MQTKAIALATVLGASLFTHLAPLAVADDAIDVAAFDYWDVIETNDGSIWKGVIVEQTPGQQYRLAMLDGSVRVLAAADVVKLTKSRNPGFHQADAGPDAPSKPFKLPTPFARSGVRIGLGR